MWPRFFLFAFVPFVFGLQGPCVAEVQEQTAVSAENGVNPLEENHASAVPQAIPEVSPKFMTAVSFHTSDAVLQHLFDAAEAEEAANVRQFNPTMSILVEGSGYNNAWIETQPMGGEMYAKRNVQVALNNQMIFILTQRADGRMPGAVVSGASARKSGQFQNHPVWMTWLPDLDVLDDFETLQGYCFPDPAWKMYFWAGKNRAYLLKLEGALEAYDAYLWRTRDSNGDGLLETWCAYDTGEDNSTRYLTRNAPTRWPFDLPPGDARTPDPADPASFKTYWRRHGDKRAPLPTRAEVLAPFASMDFMGYSFDGRMTLAKIAHELGNGREEFWRGRAEDVRQRLVKALWNPERHACFDHDRNGKPLAELVHNNLRAMYHGIFTQAMADEFVRYHLLNPAEFWTPMPLPSIAVNDPLYQVGRNNWSGQPEGLTYQRAIRALNNYGHFAEVTLLGRKLIGNLNGGGGHFAQQFDPFTGLSALGHQDKYGPTILSMLEYSSLMEGINLDVEHNEVWWSGLPDGGENFTYTQRWGDRTWSLTQANGVFTARLNDRDLFSCTTGVRVVTGFDGEVRELVGIDTVPHKVTLRSGGAVHQVTVAPNQVTRANGTIIRSTPFDYPYRALAGN